MKRFLLWEVGGQMLDLQFRFEAFNFLSADFGIPGNVLGTPDFGQINSADPGRKLQFGLKIRF